MNHRRNLTWQDQAACVNSDIAPPAFFDGELDTANGRTRQVVRAERKIAATVCAGCPVRIPCGAQAEADRLAPIDDENAIRPFGILGGLFYNGTLHPPQNPATATTRPAGMPTSQREYARQLARTATNPDRTAA